MRIAVVVTSFPVAGQPFILNQVAGYLDHGHDVTIFARDDARGDATHEDVTRYNLQSHTTYFALPTSRWRRLLGAAGVLCRLAWRDPRLAVRCLDIRRFGWTVFTGRLPYYAAALAGRRFDLVHCHWGINGHIGLFWKACGRVRVAMTEFHGYDATRDLKRFGSTSYQPLFRDCDAILAVCDAFRQGLIRYGCPAEKVRVHHTALRLDRFPPRPPGSTNHEPLRLLSVGRLAEFKGYAYSLAAVAELVRTGLAVKFTIAGGGPEQGRVERLVKELGIAANVTFVGLVSQDELVRLYHASDLLVHASVELPDGLSDGIPNTVKEAMACRLTVVATASGGTPEIVRDQQTGHLVPPGDASALAAAVRLAVETPAAKRERMLTAARQLITDEFDSDTCNATLERLVQELVR